MPLSDITCRTLKPRDREYKISDGKGLNLKVLPHGSKLWKLSYRFGGRQKSLSIGPYPKIGLADARAQRDEARRLLDAGVDPSLEKKRQKYERRTAAETTFDSVAEDWLVRLAADGKTPATIKKQRFLLNQATYWIGARPITEILTTDVYAMLRRVECSGRLETARGLRTTCSNVFRYAIMTARATHDPCASLIGATVAPTVTHMAALFDPAEIAGLLHAIRGYDGEPSTKGALRLLPLTFVRSSELRHAQWNEFDLEGGLWSIPGGRMKTKRPHIVPLARQTVALMRELWEARRRDDLVFPSIRSWGRPISNNSINAALRRMGYDKTEMTGHGWRRTASTILNENGWDGEWVERQLAHVEKNKMRRVYNAAEYLPGRIRMMQWWADWLEERELLG